MFNQLYIQTEYSILQSSCKLEPLFERLVKDKVESCAIVDEGTMYGTIKFYQACLRNKIKPIIGLKVNYLYDDMNSSLLLYAINDFGYKNLMKISSRSRLNNGIVDFEYLTKASLGLIAIIPFDESILSRYHQHHDDKAIFQIIDILKHTYDILYIGLPIPQALIGFNFNEVYHFYKNKGYKLVALPKVSYLNSDEMDAYITLKSIKMNAHLYKPLEAEKYHYLLEQEEVEFLFREYQDLIDATIEIASLCHVEIEFGKYQLPLYQADLDTSVYLKELCLVGLKKRIQNFNYSYNYQIYLKRLNDELNTINQMGFNDYFLIVYDYVKFAKKKGIFVGPGRGSAPASLVSYVLGITEVDPIYYNLLFERFLNPERISMPDIDIDFPDDRRDEVIKYVGQRYGKEKVAHIVTFGTFKVKLAINDCARVYQLPDQHLKQINKCLQSSLSLKGTNLSLKEAIENNIELQQLMEDYDDIKKVVEIAAVIQGIPRNISTHAAGIVITKYDLVNYTPLDEGLDDIYQTQYESSDLEILGLLKMDFLGLKNLTNIAKTIELIKKDNPSFVLPKKEDDEKTYKMLADGDVSGVFQLESAGMRKLIMNLKTSNLEDIIQALALYRPGPMDMIPLFIKRKFNLEKIEYPHKDLEPILKETYGTIVYQDQIMLIACKFAGYTLGRADILRRAVSKKKKEVLEQEREVFINSSIKQGYSYDDANLIYDYIVKFADYGFNKAHSVAYAKVAYLTAYLKCHYFSYYFSTLMTSFMGSTSDILDYTKQLLSRHIKVNAPSINKSIDIFNVIDGEIYFPISMIRGLGNVKTNDILEERKKGIFNNFEDFIIRCKNIIATSLIENIIYSGALDEFGLTKKAMIDQYQKIIEQSTYTFVKNVLQIDYSEDEYSYGTLQEKELEVLGMNIKYDFFKQCVALYDKYKMMKISDLDLNQNIRTMGMIKNVKEILTKQKEKMAFIELADDTSSIEVVFFPKIYFSSLPLHKGMIIMVSGNVQKRTTMQIIVNDVKKL